MLIKNFAEYIHSGFTEKVKQSFNIEIIKGKISNSIRDFRALNQNKRLDGSAWVIDLKPILFQFLQTFCSKLFD